MKRHVLRPGMLRTSGAALGLVAGLLALTGIAVAVDSDDVRGACHRESAGSASLAFTLPNGPALWERIPRAGRASELEAVNQPITVVVFEGPHAAVPIFGGLQPGAAQQVSPVLDNVVCVVADGIENSYVDVDTTGMTLDGLSIDRVEP